MFYTYILYSIIQDRFYIGHCKNLEMRLQRHNQRMVISTKNYVPWVCVYFESFGDRISANRRELEIKNKKSRKYIEWLLQK